MSGWIGFWIMCGILFATEETIDFMKWKTREIYDIKDTRKKPWWKI